MFLIELSWKAHSVNLNSFEQWIKDSASQYYCGCNANSKLELIFSQEPSSENQTSILNKWNSLDNNQDAMCTSYKSIVTIRAEKLTKKSDARTKLINLGLTAEEVDALIGS